MPPHAVERWHVDDTGCMIGSVSAADRTSGEPKVVFATDFTGDVRKGLDLATRLARDRSATLLIVHVLPLHAGRGEAMRYDALALTQGETRRTLEALQPSDEGVPYRHLLEVGDPEDILAELVAREGAGLLVLEARRMSGALRWFGGGLTARLMDRVSCPVVTYHAGADRGEQAGPLELQSDVVEPADLLVLLDARVDALVHWLQHSRHAVRSVATAVGDSAAAVYRGKAFGIGKEFLPQLTRLLSLKLREHQRALGALGVMLRHDEVLYRNGVCPLADAAFESFLSRVTAEGSAISLPLAPDPASLSAGDESGPDVIAAGAAIDVGTSTPLSLVFSLDAGRDFLRILGQPGPEPSIETYAFDADGVMLSNSRFPDELRRAGLLPADRRLQTPRRLRISDPGIDLTVDDTHRESTRPLELPLTRMAQAATAGEDGRDFQGYRDYRGVEVIGAWRWVPEYGFGVTAEMDRAALAQRRRRIG
jgi:nucleotide-binding universal stress UspA family protein